ncbi:MAG: L,D-transpeptidase family protein [Hyphomicrobiales bacterium]
MKFSLWSVVCAWAFAFMFMMGAPHAVAADNDKVAAELKTIIDSGEPSIGNEDNDERIIEVYVFYAADRDYKPIWVRDNGPKAKAKEALAVFKAANEMGLNPANYRVAEIEKRMGATSPRELAELELLLSRAFIDFGRDINRGRVVPKTASAENAIMAKELGPLTLIDGAEVTESISEYVSTLEPQTREYYRLKLALAQYREIEKKGGWPTIPKGPTLKPDMTDKRIPILRQRLMVTGDLPADAKGDGDFYGADLVEAVKRFQARHGLTDDGVIADNTLEAMNIPIADRIRQMELNLERRRWMDDDLGDYYIFVNVADQELKVVKNDKTIHTAKLVVGKPYSRTPVFSEKMKYIVINPYWNVPSSIANKEYLPKLKQDPGYLKRQNIRIFAGAGDDAAEVNPYSVNWKSLNRMPYSLRQDAGGKNALGRVKFMFPNRFNVYLHDTPAKSLFDKDLRVFSHGCMRVQDPLDLAALLLAGQGWDRSRIDVAVATGKQRVVNLEKPIPVHVTYLTAWVNKDGAVNFRRDVYNRDRQLAAALSGSLPADQADVAANAPIEE